MSFARHQTFHIRSNWLSKALEALKSDGKVFSDRSAPSRLGIGKNMVESLRFWVTACKLAEPHSKGELRLTDFGNLVYEYDRYFQDDVTWLLIHFNLISNADGATSWFLLFNRFNQPKLSKAEFITMVARYYQGVAKSSLDKDYECIVNTYVSSTSTSGNPEDNIICPLRKFGLIEKIDDGIRKVPIKVSIPVEGLYYVIRRGNPGVEYSTISEMVTGVNSIGRAFNLTIDHVYFYLTLLEDRGLVSYSKTAGLDTVRISNLDPINVLIQYYKRGIRK